MTGKSWIMAEKNMATEMEKKQGMSQKYLYVIIGLDPAMFLKETRLII